MPTITARNRIISRDLKAIENRLNKRLTAFYNNNIKDSLTPIPSLKQKHDKQLRNILSAFIFESYMVAVRHIQTNNKGLDLALSQTDMDNMQRLVNQQSEAFWKMAARLKQREIEFNTEQELIKNRIAAVHLFDTIAAFIGNAAKAVFSAFNTGIKSKLGEVRNIITDDPELTEIQFPEAITAGRVRFTTAGDSKVCPNICGPLENNEYDVDDPNIPMPPDDTHLHCRCRLIPL